MLHIQFSYLELTYTVILSQIWRESGHWARSYQFLKMEAFGEKSQTYFWKFSHRKVDENRKFQNFNFLRKNRNFEIFDFHWLFDRIFFVENKLALFHEKHPSLKINSSELSGRIPFKVGLKWPHELAPGGKTICLI